MDVTVIEMLTSHGNDVAECPKCAGQGMLVNVSDEMGDDPERKCDLCGGVGRVPGGYERAYRDLIKENEGMDGLVWALQQEKVKLELRVAELRGERDHLRMRADSLQRKYAPPPDSPRGRRPLPTG